jgi:hypothetical protein
LKKELSHYRKGKTNEEKSGEGEGKSTKSTKKKTHSKSSQKTSSPQRTPSSPNRPPDLVLESTHSSSTSSSTSSSSGVVVVSRNGDIFVTKSSIPESSPRGFTLVIVLFFLANFNQSQKRNFSSSILGKFVKFVALFYIFF